MLKRASELFGKINAYDPSAGKRRVEIYIRLEQNIESMRVGVAIDASASMKPQFGAHIPKALRPPGSNSMEPIVRTMARFVCAYSGDGTVDLLYWALGPGGGEIEPFARVDAAGCDALEIEGPSGGKWGTGTRLTPALDHFLKLEEFAAAPWAAVLFITDGVIEDMDDLKTSSMVAGQEIADGKRGDLKLVIVGVGPEVDVDQLDEIDDMFEGTDLEGKVDLWDAKVADEMEGLAEIWDEVNFGVALPGSIKISDDNGDTVLSHADGFPQLLDFEVPEACKAVTIELAGQTITQPLDG